MASKREIYNQLTQHFRKIADLSAVGALLHWDMQTQMGSMNDDAAADRGNQMATITSIGHEMYTSDKVGQWLAELQKDGISSEFNAYERKNIELLKRNYDRQVKLPTELVEEEAQLGSVGFQVWKSARENSDFKQFAPTLQKWVDLKKRKALLLEPSQDPMDTLIDTYQMGLTKSILDPLFEDLKPKLKGLLDRIEAAKKAGNGPKNGDVLLSPEGLFEISKQDKFVKSVAKEMGFEDDRGRLDVSVHPFCTTIGRQVRITTKFSPNEFYQGIAAVVHETGHSLYELGLPKEFYGQPVGEANGMGMHESQSLFWERHIALEQAFFDLYWGRLQEIYPHLSSVSAVEAYKAVNVVEPGFIRIEADEVCYPFHVILRYEIEKGMLDGSIAVEDVPAVWNKKMQDYLGVTPATDRLGCLQDVHWSDGSFGYFPTYLIGAIVAAQLHATIQKQVEGFDELVRQGNFKPILAWLRKNVHERGSLLLINDQVKEITGEPLNAKYLLEHLERKYKAIYGI